MSHLVADRYLGVGELAIGRARRSRYGYRDRIG